MADEKQVEIARLIAVLVRNELVRRLHACEFRRHDVNARLLEDLSCDGVGGFLAGFVDAVDERPFARVGALSEKDAPRVVFDVGRDADEPEGSWPTFSRSFRMNSGVGMMLSFSLSARLAVVTAMSVANFRLTRALPRRRRGRAIAPAST